MASPRITVLLIDDEPDYARVLRERLSREVSFSFNVESASSLDEGRERLARDRADVVLLDLNLPESRGLETYLMVHAQVPEIPVIVLTAIDNDALALEAVRRGAQDFIVKGQFDGRMLARIIRYAIERHRMQAALEGLSLLDELTGLYNRRGFLRLAEQHLKLAVRTKRGSLLLFVDLDGLKRINDSLGHAEGDRALEETAEILKGAFRTSDVIGRIGGDEFALLAIDARQDSAQRLVERLQEKLAEANQRPDRSYRLSLSIGPAMFDHQQPLSLDALIAQADAELYARKRTRRA